MKKQFVVRLDSEIERMIATGSVATSLEKSELVRQGLLAGIPRVVEGLLGARSATPAERRHRARLHIRKYAGSWQGMKGRQMLERTRP